MKLLLPPRTSYEEYSGGREREQEAEREGEALGLVECEQEERIESSTFKRAPRLGVRGWG
jgi:hypothetical protein